MKRKLIIIITIISLFASLNLVGVKADEGAGYLIKTVPSGAMVYVNAKYIGITPYVLTVNNSEIRIVKGGYFEITQKITSLVGGETLSLKMLQKRSALYLKGTPEKITYSIKETRQAGVTPAIIDNLEAGNYTIIFSKNGFKSLTKNIVLNGGLTALIINLTAIGGVITPPPIKPTPPPVPAKEYSNVTVNTNVIGCQIYLSGTYKGLSPLVLKNLEVGRTYLISAKKSGYNSNSTNYFVEKNGLITLNLTVQNITPPTIKTTFLNVKSNIAASNIYISGVNHIGNNVTVYGLKVGTYVAVRITKTGYMTQTRTVTIRANGNYTAFTLKKVTPPKVYTSLIVDSEPGGATVSLISTGLPVLKGTTPLKLQGLIVGMRYTLVLRRENYSSTTFSFTAAANGTPLIFNLTPIG